MDFGITFSRTFVDAVIDGKVEKIPPKIFEFHNLLDLMGYSDIRDNYYFIYLASNFVIVKVHQGLGFSGIFSTFPSVTGIHKSSRKCNSKIYIVTTTRPLKKK